jgi:hypothetical protein
VLAYVFWHRPRETYALDDYEQAHVAFHRSLARTPPVGMRASAAYRAPELPWLGGGGCGYEDWYLLEDFNALGVLNEAAVGRGHRTAHDRVARRYGAGAAGLYCLLEGDARDLAGEPAQQAPATWVARPVGSSERPLGELLGDGMDPRCASLWRRMLVLGPAPEYCLIAPEASRGVAETRLPSGWSALTVDREVLYGG